MSFGPPHASPRDVERVRDLYRRLVDHVGEPDGSDIDIGVLTPGERAVYVLMTAVDLVAQGGFDAMAFARSKMFAEPPRKRSQSEFRRMLTAVESNGDAMGQLDDELDALMANPGTRIEALLVRYIENAPQEFVDL